MSYSAFFFLLSCDYHVVICVSKRDHEQTVDTWPTNDSYESSCRRDRFSAIAGNFCFFFFFFPSITYFNIVRRRTLWNCHTDNESSKKKEEVQFVTGNTAACGFLLLVSSESVTRRGTSITFSQILTFLWQRNSFSIVGERESLPVNRACNNTDRYHCNVVNVWEQEEGSYWCADMEITSFLKGAIWSFSLSFF